VHRLSRDVTQLLLHSASLPAREIKEAAEWMVRTILHCAGRVSRFKIESALKETAIASSPLARSRGDRVHLSADD
jgi:hypothetical protein